MLRTASHTMRTNRPSIVLLVSVAGVTSAWAPVASGTGRHRARITAATSSVRTATSPGVDAYPWVSRRPVRGGSYGAAAPTASLRAASAMPPLIPGNEDDLPLALDAMSFIDSSPDPFHAIRSAAAALEGAGFVEWEEDDDDVALEPGGKYYFTRNRSTLVAFAVGSRYEPGNGFKIIGSHTDSPNLRVKPRSRRTTSKDGGSSGAIQLAVECYGGGLWHTWFDRDLGLSGRVFVRDGDRIGQELIKINRAILHIPNLAIHLQTAKEREAFKVNKEDHVAPVLATAVENSLGNKGGDGTDDDGWMRHQEPLLVQLLASELGVNETDIIDFELSLFDVQPGVLGGAHSEFVHSARLDNLASCFLSLRGLIDHVEDSGVERDSDISMIAMFDHEEVGSLSATGAGSPVMGEAVRRISHALGADGPILYDRAIQRSFVLSVDQAHAVHPNYASKHEKGHGPRMNGGMVIKRNSNQRYATNAITGLVIRELGKRAGLPPMQEFVVRNDCACGSTIGPIISAATGMRAIDMGCPQLSMHSVRETMGVRDFSHGLALFRAFFGDFSSVDGSIEK